jgi:uncharacterized repeat protein (TIGR01451 family)
MPGEHIVTEPETFITMRLFQFVPARIAIGLLLFAGHTIAQDKQPQRPQVSGVELLTMNGGQPELGPDGEGITSFITSDLFKRGQTHVKPFNWSFKVELPVGYTLFNKLAYMIDTEAVFSGPNDFTFRIPSAPTSALFEKLRILYADYDQAQPDKPRWIDATVEPPFGEYWERYLPRAEFDKRLPDFTTRTLHAFMEESPRILVIAVKDSAIARDNFVADIAVSATPDPPSVMEGRDILYTFKITNNGPDTATGVSFRSYVDPEFVSLKQSQGVCRWDAHNIYCNLGEIPKGSSATVSYAGKCTWNFYNGDQPGKSGGMDATPLVQAAEGDANFENNQVFASASVVKDQNKAPVVTISSPSSDQFFVGPEVSVNIVANAYDTDGSVAEVQIYNEQKLLGNAKLTVKNTYQLTYDHVPYGQHFLRVIVTDNQGRPSQTPITSFFVNGQAKVEILTPAPNQVITGPIGDLVVTVRATDPARAIKKVIVHSGTQFGVIPQVAEPSARKNEYTTTLKDMGMPGRHTLYVVVTDDAGVDTVTYPMQFRITEPPYVTLHYVDGEYSKEFQSGTALSAGVPIKLITDVSHSYDFDHPVVAKLEVFANGQLICNYINKDRKEPTLINADLVKCSWSPAPGKYTLTATAVDSDGAVGKSKPVEVIVR